MNHIPNTRLHYSSEYSTLFELYANMQKLDLGDITIVKQIHKYLTKTIMYIC